MGLALHWSFSTNVCNQNCVARCLEPRPRCCTATNNIHYFSRWSSLPNLGAYTPDSFQEYCTKCYSHKFEGPALDYEIGISLYENKVVWVNDPFKASKHDITIFRSALKAKIPKGKLVIADLGYRGEKKIIAVPNSHDVAEVRDFKGRARARQESFNKKIKNCKVLSEKFRHGVEKHQMCFQACVVLAQYQLENGSPLFDV